MLVFAHGSLRDLDDPWWTAVLSPFLHSSNLSQRPCNPGCHLNLVHSPQSLCSYFDGEVRTLLQRHTRKRTSSTGIDLRAGALPLSVPPPGDPSRSGLHVSEMTWSIKADHEWLIRVAPLRSKQPTFGFLVQEAGRCGRGWGLRGFSTAAAGMA